MEIEKSFRVEVPVEPVWAALTDLARVARCLPGADLTEVDADGVHRGAVAVKLGPVAMSFAGEARFEEIDETGRRLVVTASGRERRGRGAVRARIPVELVDEGGVTRVDVVATLDMSGAVAQFGRRGGILEDVSDELIEQFVHELRADILHGAPVPAVLAPAAGSQPSPAVTATDTGAATVVPMRPTNLNPRTGLWAHIPPPQATPGSAAALDATARTPDAATPWPPPAPAVRAKAAAPTLSALGLARAILKRRAKRVRASAAERFRALFPVKRRTNT